MKEFVVCYTLENEIKREKIIKELDVKKEEVVQEILEKVKNNKYFVAKSEQGDYWINTSQIRYIRVFDEKSESNYQYQPSVLSM